MSGELTDKVKLQIEEILKKADKPGIDVEAMCDRVSEILEERLPGFLAAIVAEALVEQIAKYGRDIRCKHFTGLYRKCKKGKIAGEACLSCDDYEPARRRK
ncbi:unnamed protein product [marine sediment metagenome]|uniref:Uncharacterized protein n=1 Tax=marine sediment metagenome TaxID=412755 RepID=X1MID7_9ZZZZ